MTPRARRLALCSAAAQLDLLEPSRVRLSLCQVSLSTEGGKPPEWIELVPAGPDVKAVDGREFRNTKPERVVEAFRKYGIDIPIDWEHATQVKAPEGDEAPAAGWITALEVRAGAVWGKVDWTPRGAASLTSREYRFVSPAFLHDKTGNVTDLVSAALTNRPALTQLTALASQWSTAYVNDLPDSAFLFIEKGGEKDAEGKTMPRSMRHLPVMDANGQPDAPHLRNALARLDQVDAAGMDREAIRKHAEEMLKKCESTASEDPKKKPATCADQESDMNPELLKLLGLDPKATPEQALAAVKAMQDSTVKVIGELATARSELAKVKTPDLAKFVPRADFEVQVARAQAAEKVVAEKDAAKFKAEVDAEIDAALKAAKIAPSTKDFYLSTCSTTEGLAKFREFVKTAPAVTERSGLDGKKPPEGNASDATAEELAIATNCGISREAFLASKKAIAAAR